MSGDDRKRDSQRAQDAVNEAERQKLVDAAKGKAQTALTTMLEEYLDEEEDTAIRDAKDLLTDEQREELTKKLGLKRSSMPASPPPITRPSPEALRESRHEPTTPPTIPSPAPKMTPPKGGILMPSYAPVSSGMPRPITPVTFPPSADAPSSRRKILVVDDDEAILDVLAEILSAEGYRVWRARDGLDGIKRLFQMGRIDLILLDIAMPRVSGTEFLEVLDASPWAGTPVVIISAYRPKLGEVDDRYIYLGKPIVLEDLLATVRRRIKEGHA